MATPGNKDPITTFRTSMMDDSSGPIPSSTTARTATKMNGLMPPPPRMGAATNPISGMTHPFPGSPKSSSSTRPFSSPLMPSIPGAGRSLSLSPTHLAGRHRLSATPYADGSLLLPGNNMPFLNPCNVAEHPPRFSDTQKAMEHAVAAERQRAKDMEATEKNLSADELRAILKQERHRMASFARTIAELRSTAVQCQSEAEIHEEGRVNCLLGSLERMQMEKGRIINELEREEEMLTNTLQKKLDKVKKEKAELEKLIEREKLSHSNLESKLTGLREGRVGQEEQTDFPEIQSNGSNLGIVASSKTTALPPLDSLEEGESEEEQDGEEKGNEAMDDSHQ